jgi:glycosyltransferase involved in cell wall biosynthesis
MVVEHQADIRSGHYMKELESITTALRSDGHEVHVLVPGRMAIEAEGRTLEGVHVHRIRRRWTRLAAVGGSLTRFGLRLRRPLRNPIMAVGRLLHQGGLVFGVTAEAKKHGEIPVLLLSHRLRYEYVAALAPRRARWAAYTLPAPRRSQTQIKGVVARILWMVAARRERRRRRSGAWVRLVVNHDVAASRWRRLSAWIEPYVAPLAAVSAVDPLPKQEARAALRVPEEGCIALAFGTPHGGKDTATTLRAFAEEPTAARLVVAGLSTQRLIDDMQRADHSLAFENVTVFDGPQDDERKRLLFSAADVAVLSFRRGRVSDSGGLADAVSYGLTVCCSDGCATGDLVRELSLGVLFAQGNTAALRAALKEALDFDVAPDGRDAYVRVRSATNVTRRLLELTVTPSLDR